MEPCLAPAMATLLPDAFVAASTLLPPELRRSFVLVGGAVLARWGCRRYTPDLDVACSKQALIAFTVAAREDARFSEAPDGNCEDGCIYITNPATY